MVSVWVVKIAFLYVASNRSMVGQTAIIPTYRVSMRVYPELKKPHFSVAASKITSDGRILPYVIVKEAEEFEVKTEYHRAGTK
jgi:hypothetical protein